MFIDLALIKVQAGKGGNGVVSFHREKYVASGGPDGGDGGKGGDIILKVDHNLNTLVDFHLRTEFKAQDGENGKRNNCAGKSAPNIVIKLPQGTIVRDKESKNIIIDLSEIESFVIAKGGRGGRGNQHFATPSHQVPNFAIPGEKGVTRDLILELKILADVGLIGFPNVGKSTLISALSNAHPKIANYPFTTLQPHLGVVCSKGCVPFVVADIPGLIEGASGGAGLGLTFLRHVERCRLLWHVVDAAAIDSRDPISDIEIVNGELANFSSDLCKKQQILIANKSDAATPEQIQKLKNYAQKNNVPFFVISAATQSGLKQLKEVTLQMIKNLPPVKIFTPEFHEELTQTYRANQKEFKIEVKNGVFIIQSEYLARILKSGDLLDYESLLYFQKMLIKTGVDAELKKLGIQKSNTVIIDGINFEFEYIP
ncbi:MAG: GTPase ObgE [Oscillospiraceae bacterium]|jgi:GTP-binding protein|nr:GTPase ObgE [Oscillospiraceae bacterium]